MFTWDAIANAKLTRFSFLLAFAPLLLGSHEGVAQFARCSSLRRRRTKAGKGGEVEAITKKKRHLKSDKNQGRRGRRANGEIRAVEMDQKEKRETQEKEKCEYYSIANRALSKGDARADCEMKFSSAGNDVFSNRQWERGSRAAKCEMRQRKVRPKQKRVNGELCSDSNRIRVAARS